VRLTLKVRWLAIPLAIVLLGCDKEGGSNLKVRDKGPEIKRLNPGGDGDKAKPTPI
jgi:hypothetical protein